MVRNQKVTGTAGTLPAGVVLGLMLSLGVTLAGAAVTAWLLSAERIGEGGTGYCALVILVLSSALGAWLAMARIRRLRMQVCLLTGLCYYLLLLAMTALLFGGQYEGMGITALAVLGGSGSVAVLGAQTGKHGKGYHRKSAYR